MCSVQLDMLCKLLLTAVLPLVEGAGKLALGMCVAGAYLVPTLFRIPLLWPSPLFAWVAFCAVPVGRSS